MESSFEQSLSYNLVQSSRRKGSSQSETASREYRAVLKREAPLGTDEIIAECIRDYRLPNSAESLRHAVEIVLTSMIEHTRRDGRCRRLDDFLTLRMDITGSFPRPDAEFNPMVNTLSLSFQAARRLKAVKRKTWPRNEKRRPRGKISAVYSPSGEIGTLKYGADIVVEGHDLLLVGQDALTLFITLREGTFEFGLDIKENTDTRIVAAFPASPMLKPDFVVGAQGQVAHFAYTSSSHLKGQLHGRRCDVVFVA